MHQDVHQESSPSLTRERQGTGISFQDTHTQLYVHTLWKSSPAVWLPFSSSPSEPLGETSQPQSHLPPLSPRLIHHITSSLKPLFPWQPGVTHSGPLGVDYMSSMRMKTCMKLQPACLPVHSRSRRRVLGRLRGARVLQHVVHEIHDLCVCVGGGSVDTLSVVADISMMACYNHAPWSGRSILNPERVPGPGLTSYKHKEAACWLSWGFFSHLGGILGQRSVGWSTNLWTLEIP